MTLRQPAWALSALLFLALAVGGCRRDEPEQARAPGDPVAAVEGLARALRDNDLVRYSRLSLPPALHARSEALWNRRVAEAGPPDPQDAEEYDRTMARLTAPDAEAALMRDLEPKLARFQAEVDGQWPLLQATATLFLNAAIQANTELSSAEKAHGGEVVAGLMSWAQPALLTDRERARKAIRTMARTARALDLPTLAQARALPMMPALEKGGIALAGAKDVLRVYGLDLDQALDGVRAELVSSTGDRAMVKVSYPLLDKTVSFEMALVRRDGGWYSAESVRAAEQELAEAADGGPAQPAEVGPESPVEAAPDGPAPANPTIEAPTPDVETPDTAAPVAAA